VYIWRDFTGDAVVHYSINFERAMAHAVMGILAAVSPSAEEGESAQQLKQANEYMKLVQAHPGQHNIQILKYDISDLSALCKMRDMYGTSLPTDTDGLVEPQHIIQLCTDILNISPTTNESSALYKHIEKMNKFISNSLCEAYIVQATQNDRWDVAEHVCSIMGDEQRTLQYKTFRQTVQGKSSPLDHEEWLASIHVSLTPHKDVIEETPTHEIVPGFDTI
jgi:hypothetical protein